MEPNNIINTKHSLYKEYYERILIGERDIDIAFEIGCSVTTLYERLTEYGILQVKKRHSEETWDKAYNFYLAGKSVINIAKDLDVKSATVYNHFASRGYKVKERKSVDRLELYQDYKSGMTKSDLACKYNRTMTHIRTILRQEALHSK